MKDRNYAKKEKKNNNDNIKDNKKNNTTISVGYPFRFNILFAHG